MNWVDLVVLAVIVLSGLLAFMRGFVREALGLGAWIVAAVVASQYGVFPYVQPWMRQQFTDPTLADTVAYGGVFLLVLLVLSLLAGSLSRAVQYSALGGLDRTLGLLFGFARGAALVAVAYILVGLAIAVDQWPSPVLQARFLPEIYRGAAWIALQLPAGYRPVVAPPPPVQPTSAAMLQPNPVGAALARPPRE